VGTPELLGLLQVVPVDGSGGWGKASRVDIEDVAQVAAALSGVRRTERDGLIEWRYHGRLVARQLDETHLVIRTEFDYRNVLLPQFPETFSAARHYVKHIWSSPILPMASQTASKSRSKRHGSSSATLIDISSPTATSHLDGPP
jgi:hypothetical protein